MADNDNEQGGLWPALKKAIKTGGRDPDADKALAEETSKKLPKALMPREGIEEDRRRKAMIDALKSE